MMAQSYMAEKSLTVKEYMDQFAKGLKAAPKEFPRVGEPVEKQLWSKFLPGNTAQVFDFFDIKVKVKLINWDKTEEEIKEVEGKINNIVNAADQANPELHKVFFGTVFITFAESDDCVNIINKYNEETSFNEKNKIFGDLPI
jgi:hypothetical protein